MNGLNYMVGAGGNNAECKEWREKMTNFIAMIFLAGGGGMGGWERVCNICSKIPQQGQILAGIESIKVKLEIHIETTYLHSLLGKQH